MGLGGAWRKQRDQTAADGCLNQGGNGEGAEKWLSSGCI